MKDWSTEELIDYAYQKGGMDAYKKALQQKGHKKLLQYAWSLRMLPLNQGGHYAP